MRNLRFATLTSVTENYLRYLEAQLNMLAYYGHRDIDVHVIALDCDPARLAGIRGREWPFYLIIHDGYLHQYEYPNNNQRAKKARYHGIREYCMDYDVLLFLDADLYPVANLMPFFEMVHGTDVILGVNERFKWNMARYAMRDPSTLRPLDHSTLRPFDPSTSSGLRAQGSQDRSLPDQPMSWMICNAPTFFCPGRHAEFVEQLIDTSGQLYEIEKNATPSDLFTMNVAIYLAGVQDNVIALPHYLWTQTHKSMWNEQLTLQRHGDVWRSWSGEKAYMLHGRWDRDKRTDDPVIQRMQGELERMLKTSG